MIDIVVGFIISALLLALAGLISDEVRGWLELAPRAILRLAAMRLPADQREAIYNQEWLPEVIFILRKADGRPITRLIIGTWYAASMIRSAGRIARSLAPVRNQGLAPAQAHGRDRVSVIATTRHIGQGISVEELIRNGWQVTRSGGSHYMLTNGDSANGKAVSVPASPGMKRAIKRGRRRRRR